MLGTFERTWKFKNLEGIYICIHHTWYIITDTSTNHMSFYTGNRNVMWLYDYRYCVKQFNLQQQSKQGNDATNARTDTAVLSPLKFSRVESAQKQVVAGTKYYLRIAVTQPDGTSRMFDSVIVIQPWLFSKKLIEFTPVASPVY